MDWSRHPRVRRAAHCLHDGGVIAYPTEAVWGLGCDPFNPLATARLLQLKRRPLAKGLILVAADLQQVQPWLARLTEAQCQTLEASWPGPITWLLPNHGLAPPWITGDHRSVAIRVSAHPLVVGLCRAFGGPLVSTSANPAGRPPARNTLKVRRYFGDTLDDVTPGQVGPQDKPSEIRDLLTGRQLRP